jgi:hypothetical protein
MRVLGITLACLVGLATPVAAAQLTTPPITQSGGSLVECSIANISGSGAKVVITVINNDAALTSVTLKNLAAGTSRSTFDFCPSGMTCTRPRCVFTTSTPAGNFRASGCVANFTNTNTDKICLPAQ